MSSIKIISLIPARSGSKGLVDKNILTLNGKPMMAYSIEASIKSKLINKTMVSTNNQSYADIANKCSAEVPYLRSENLATDTAAINDVVREALTFYQNKGEVFDIVLLLQPTSPLRTTQHIEEAINLFLKKINQADSLVSVVAAPQKTKWLLKAEGESVDFVFDVDKTNPRRQALGEDKLYYPNGAIYLAKVEKFSGFYTARTLYYEMPSVLSLDVDTIEDFKLAENYLKKV
jgi:CMP-N-acetylneuraminic acid synthetase